MVVTRVFQSEGRGFEPNSGLNFLQQEIHPQCGALNPGEVNGYLVGIYSLKCREPNSCTAKARVIMLHDCRTHRDAMTVLCALLELLLLLLLLLLFSYQMEDQVNQRNR